ncbi:MAG: hypothetical protein A3K11_11100 [Nitrospirae bacterium RIFCSPLOWO2_12_FULL_63_8]|nr:MAG: hypothetical protein A3K11_11100 [Nitrospirae bacterium RIFCSPLOWO2_12_FULL_63_8]
MPPKKSKAKAAPPPPAPAGADKVLKGVDEDAVVRLAYELYVRRGGEHGHDVEDWLMAEQLLLEQQKRSGPSRRTVDASRRVEDKFRRR